MVGVPLDELLPLAAALMAGGVVAGLLAGLFGVGGGVIAVPVLYEVFRVLGVPDAVHMQLCIGTSLAIMAPTNIRSYLTHRASGAVLADASITASHGARLAHALSRRALEIAFGLFLLAAALRFLVSLVW